MTGLRFEVEWESAGRARGAELRATWARWGVWVGDQCVTLVRDLQSKSYRPAVYGPVYPLAEWIVGNWWPLTCEPEHPVRRNTPEFKQRHSLRYAAEGFAVPDLQCYREGEGYKLTWTPLKEQAKRVEFTSEGRAFIDRAEFIASTRRFVTDVIARLKASNVDDTFLETEWNQIESHDDEEIAFCRVAGAGGYDPYDLEENTAQTLRELADRLGDSQAEETLDALLPDEIAQASAWANSSKRKLNSFSAPINGLQQLNPVSLFALRAETPWKQGYEIARQLRTEKSDSLVAGWIDEIAHHRTVGISQAPSLIDGLAGTSSEVGYGLVTAKQHPISKRFAAARSLFGMLLPPDSPGTAVLTSLRSSFQQQTRAFAAELLAPAEKLRSQIAGDILSPDECDELADQFRVSSEVIRLQCRNHKIVPVSWG